MCRACDSRSEPLWEQLADDLWTVWRPLSFFGLPLGCRMTLARLADGGLWVHSAFDPGEPLRQKMEQLGRVTHVVCPNRMHHMLVGDLLRHHPEAELHLSPCLPKKRPDLKGRVLEEEGPQEWLPDLEHHCLAGNLFLDELVFFHRPSRSLIVTDLIWAHFPDAPWYLRLLTGSGHAPPPEVRALFYPRQKARQSLEAIMKWDFDRIVLSHGPLVKQGGKEVMARAFSFLLD